MPFESAAGRHVPNVEHTGETRPVVTEDEHILIELVLTEPPDQLWRNYFDTFFRDVSIKSIAWANPRPANDGQPTITFRLESVDELLPAVEAIGALIRRVTAAWRQHPDMAAFIEQQRRIDQLDDRLRRNLAGFFL